MNAVGKRKIHVYCILTVIILTGFIARIFLFSQSNFVSGVDGGYYAFQTQQILAGNGLGEPIYKSNPVIFYTSAFFALLFGVHIGVMIATGLFSVLIGVSVFLLTQYLFKDNKAALVATVFVIFSPLALRMMADVRKNVAGLFFMSLFFYFLFKSFEDKKYFVGVIVTGLLGFLSHQSIIVVYFVIMAYIVLQFVILGNVKLNESIIIGILAIPALFALIFLFSYVLEGLQWITASQGIYHTNFMGLERYLVVFVIAATPGVLVCIKQRKREHIFLLAWILTGFLLLLSAVSGDYVWRFALIYYVPLAIAAGLTFSWLYEKTKKLAIVFFLIILSIIIWQFFFYGTTDYQMQPLVNEHAMQSLDKSSSIIQDHALVLTTMDPHQAYWVRYYYGDIVEVVSANNLARHSNDIMNNNDSIVYILVMKQNIQNSAADDIADIDEDSIEKVFDDEYLQLYNIIGVLAESENHEQKLTVHNEEYNTARLYVLASYIILPYEFIYMLHPSYVGLFQAIIGINASIAILGFLMIFCAKGVVYLPKWMQYALIILCTITIGALFLFHPGFFWGSSSDNTNHKLVELSSNDNHNYNDEEQSYIEHNRGNKNAMLCPDGYCDEAELADPKLCPMDCTVIN